ncbi:MULTISPECIES: hypothetical protein [Streptosporangium]|uniref:Uncharacterized protein n=1 Tax=Streptosporangium brasiliense TaxID=47480 RepID=A0ABT9RD03_9ACTN|nr:hypothetical protein [Streptosporangium brasiliense]MDP9866285.1 hypothetical protein [Streptosporangium brasiliense]
MKIVFKQLFESFSKSAVAWCTTSYGSSIDIVFDSPIFLRHVFGQVEGVGGHHEDDHGEEGARARARPASRARGEHPIS